MFGDKTTFEKFRRRFFNRREPLFSLIQDHPLLGRIRSEHRGVPQKLGLGVGALRQIAELLVTAGEQSNQEKPDRRLLLAATKQVAVQTWRESANGKDWLASGLGDCSKLAEMMVKPAWLEAREPLSCSQRAGRVRRTLDPEGGKDTDDPLDVEGLDDEAETTKFHRTEQKEIEAWVRRLREDAIGVIIAPYFRRGVISREPRQLPLLTQHHGELLSQFDLDTRAIAGQVFRRVLMAEEFLLRYLADVERDNAQH